MEVKYGIRLYKVEIYYQMFFIHFTILGRTLERLADTWQTLHGRCGSVSGLPWTRIGSRFLFTLFYGLNGTRIILRGIDYRVKSKNVEVTSKPRAARPGQAGPARA